MEPNRSFDARLEKAIELVNSNTDQWIVWGLKNNETDLIAKQLTEAVNEWGINSVDISDLTK